VPKDWTVSLKNNSSKHDTSERTSLPFLYDYHFLRGSPPSPPFQVMFWRPILNTTCPTKIKHLENIYSSKQPHINIAKKNWVVSTPLKHMLVPEIIIAYHMFYSSTYSICENVTSEQELHVCDIWDLPLCLSHPVDLSVGKLWPLGSPLSKECSQSCKIL
jgi:hypothetical protein